MPASRRFGASAPTSPKGHSFEPAFVLFKGNAHISKCQESPPAYAAGLVVLSVGKTFLHECVGLLEPSVREFFCELTTGIEAHNN
jgi:hypothetical protein